MVLLYSVVVVVPVPPVDDGDSGDDEAMALLLLTDCCRLLLLLLLLDVVVEKKERTLAVAAKVDPPWNGRRILCRINNPSLSTVFVFGQLKETAIDDEGATKFRRTQ